jgi:hypothetical protein
MYTVGYADPIFKGDYPLDMRKRCGDRLPTFTVCLLIYRNRTLLEVYAKVFILDLY